MSFFFGPPPTLSALRDTCIRTQEFILDWPRDMVHSNFTRNYNSGSDHFTLFVNLDYAGDVGYSFKISPRTSFAHSYTIKTPSGTCLASGPLAYVPAFGGLDYHVLGSKILASRIENVNGRYQVIVCLSSQQYFGPAPTVPKPFASPPPAAPTPAALFLDRLYNDVDNRDVLFIFKSSNLKATNKILVKKAHKLVLCQWPYFKRMFSSDFMEGGAGEKEVQIKDVKPSTFQMLLRFMYTGDLPRLGRRPSTTFIDALTNAQDTSWEDVFLAAHRYELEDLCKIAQKEILNKLSPQVAIPFLFRTGYLFESLREPCIKYIASTSASRVASKSFRDAYQDHSDFAGLVFELFEACHAK